MKGSIRIITAIIFFGSCKYDKCQEIPYVTIRGIKNSYNINDSLIIDISLSDTNFFSIKNKDNSIDHFIPYLRVNHKRENSKWSNNRFKFIRKIDKYNLDSLRNLYISIMIPHPNKMGDLVFGVNEEIIIEDSLD